MKDLAKDSQVYANKISKKICEDIPLANFMEFGISELGQTLAKTTLPLGPNVNHLGTGFGGSLYSFGALTCYSLVLYNLEILKFPNPYVVIASGEVKYLQAVRENMSASVMISNKEQEQFVKTLQSKGVAKINLEANIISSGNICAEFRGVYVAKKARR